MADGANYVDSEAKTDTTEASQVHTNNKRKRNSLDADSATSRPAPGNNSSGLNDQSGTAFLTGHSGAAEEDMHHQSNADLDFGAQLAQHNNDHNLHQNGGANPSNASDTAAAALSHHFSMTVPQATELSFQNQSAGGENDRPLSSSFGMSEHNMHHGVGDYGLDSLKANTQGSPSNESPPEIGGRKPPVGSEEWHKVRRDNHKEVERRRRETINEGINELAKIVPGCEKNKGSILQRAVQFITQLKENESQNIEKWTLEKLLTEQAITELSASCDKFKGECQRAWQEVEIWKKACQNAGITPPEYQEGDEKADQNGDS
ncbi:hypothetical protein K490DRAFT_74877 [Saccharata proteae CBS 121410]|uniref:BHLH domain-containing protein n=1 Tax=Saccharata proteae CBS 121410 TaxID=1314787 RepID=A0A9P4HTH5_9PEZI|nr:hypothetical protein K490DRAFT_74877 [Saccharata proteae CBS 121410]